MREKPGFPVPRRGLLDQPQRFGLWPTLWFWNNRERQLFLLPLLSLTVLPAIYVSTMAIIRHHLSPWLIVGVALLSPLLLMGIVERHLRRVIGGLPAAERLDHAGPPPPSGRLLPTLLAALCAVSAMVLAYDLVRLGSLVLVLAGAVVAACWFPRTWRALRERALAEHGRVALRPGETASERRRCLG